VRLLSGARQTGKTQLLRHSLPEERTQLFNLQESGLRRQFEADPAAFSRAVKALPQRIRIVAVDEIQKVPALLDEVQDLHDANPSRWQFFLTGSSARRLKAGASNLLPGRSHSYRIFPVCAWETDRESQPGEIAARRSPGRRSPEHRASAAPTASFPETSLHRRLLLGSLPGIWMESGPTAARTLDSYVETYLEEEIRREALIRDIGPFLVFLRLAALESGRPTNLSKLAQESGVPASTLKTYYQVLVDTFVGYWVPAYGGRSRKRLLTTPRFLFFDTGVRNAAAQLPLGGKLPESEAGALLEQWVGQELMARAGYLGRGHRVTFWRTVSGAEVDYVWESPKEDIPIEVKHTARPRPVDARHLETFLDEHPGRARRGLIVCRCERAEQLTERVRAIPWRAL
jgi:predicted AAA+ superfamily ATPase